jgi:hypothetical protein
VQFVHGGAKLRERLLGRPRTVIWEHVFNIATTSDTIKPFAYIL